MNIVFLNGKWREMESATISVFDRGFMFGDAIYEVMSVYGGVIYEKNAHLNRLKKSLDAVKIGLPFSRKRLENILEEGLEKNKASNALIYLQVSRGVQFPRNHRVEANIEPTVLITVTNKKILDWEEIDPLEVITKVDFRWSRGDIKVTSLIANVMLRNEAVIDGYDDAILVRDEKVTEATSANVFLVKNGVVMTPKKSRFFLHGITRQTVLRLSDESGFQTIERDISKKELFEADEVWLSSTGNELRPVRKVDGEHIGKNWSLANSVWRKVYEGYREDTVSAS